MLTLDPDSIAAISRLLKDQSTTAAHIISDIDSLYSLAIQADAYTSMDPIARANLYDTINFLKKLMEVMEEKK